MVQEHIRVLKVPEEVDPSRYSKRGRFYREYDTKDECLRCIVVSMNYYNLSNKLTTKEVEALRRVLHHFAAVVKKIGYDYFYYFYFYPESYEVFTDMVNGLTGLKGLEDQSSVRAWLADTDSMITCGASEEELGVALWELEELCMS